MAAGEHVHSWEYSAGQALMTNTGVKCIATRYCKECLVYQELNLKPIQPVTSEQKMPDTMQYMDLSLLENCKNELGGLAGYEIRYIPSYDDPKKKYQGIIFIFKSNPTLYGETIQELFERMVEYCKQMQADKK